MHTATRSLTPPQIADRLGVGVSKVLGWITSGELLAINVATNRQGRPRWVIEPEEFDRFKAGRSSTPPSPPKKQRRAAVTKEYF